MRWNWRSNIQRQRFKKSRVGEGNPILRYRYTRILQPLWNDNWATATARESLQRKENLSDLKRILTSVEHHLADHDPSGGEVQMYLEKSSFALVQPYRDVSRVLQHDIRYVGVGQWLLLVGGAIYAEPNVRFREYLGAHREFRSITSMNENSFSLFLSPFFPIIIRNKLRYVIN